MVINLKKQGIRFHVCGESLRSERIAYKKDLYGVDEKDIVPSGVVTIAVLQAKGYSYVKPSETTNAK